MINRKGITLTELLIATVIIGVVILGVSALSVNIKQMQASTGKVTILETQLMTAMADIEKNATLAAGHAANKGMVIDPVIPRWFSFRQDAGTPSDFSDDTWVSYWLAPVGGSSEVLLYVCKTPATATVPDPAANPIAAGCDNTNSTLLLQNIDWNLLEFQLVENTNFPNLSFYFEISITTRNDVDKGPDPLTNPEATLSSRFSSPLHTW